MCTQNEKTSIFQSNTVYNYHKGKCAYGTIIMGSRAAIQAFHEQKYLGQLGLAE